jgi:Tfp pilus assembly protein FimV
VTRRGWRPYAAPAAFLLAATIAVLVARSFMNDGSGAAPVHSPRPTTTAPAAARKSAPAARPRLYTVRAGDTLTAIAARSGVPLARIRLLNPRLEPTALFIGEKIRLR